MREIEGVHVEELKEGIVGWSSFIVLSLSGRKELLFYRKQILVVLVTGSWFWRGSVCYGKRSSTPCIVVMVVDISCIVVVDIASDVIGVVVGFSLVCGDVIVDCGDIGDVCVGGRNRSSKFFSDGRRRRKRRVAFSQILDKRAARPTICGAAVSMDGVGMASMGVYVRVIKWRRKRGRR